MLSSSRIWTRTMQIYMYIYYESQPVGLGEVSPCERSENKEGCGGGGWLTQGPFLAEIEVFRVAVLSVWQPFVPLGNFGTVRWGQRLESTLVGLPGVV